MKSPRWLRLVFVVALGLNLVACAPLITQSPGGTLSPANVVALDTSDRVMLKGADVVAYFTKNAYTQGSSAHQSVHQNLTFYFASAEHKALFDQAPSKYIPQFGGYCANGMAYGIPWGGDADTWRLIDGRLYIFGGATSRDAFGLDTKANLAHAKHYWTTEVQGNNALIQRAKRMLFKVPHYLSDAQVAERLKAQSAKTPS